MNFTINKNKNLTILADFHQSFKINKSKTRRHSSVLDPLVDYYDEKTEANNPSCNHYKRPLIISEQLYQVNQLEALMRTHATNF